MAAKLATKKTVNFGAAKGFEDLMKEREARLKPGRRKPGPKYFLALNVFEQRKKKGWTQVEAAERAGVAYNTYLDIEQAQPTANPSAETLIKMADAFGISVSGLWEERS
jgi:DNA-binding XRE family transcriptional regulator